MRLIRVVATKNGTPGYPGVYYQVGQNKYVLHRGYQFLQFSSTDNLEEVTNKAVVMHLLNDHNHALMNAVELNELTPMQKDRLLSAMIDVDKDGQPLSLDAPDVFEPVIGFGVKVIESDVSLPKLE